MSSSNSAGSTVLLVLAVLAIMVFLVAYYVPPARRAIVRAVFKGNHTKGQDQVTRVDNYVVPTHLAGTAEAIVRVVNAHASAPALVGGLYLSSRHDDGLVFAFGNKIAEAFAAVVTLTPQGTGTAIQVQVARWTESNGLVNNQNEIIRLRQRVADAASSLGGQPVAQGSMH